MLWFVGATLVVALLPDTTNGATTRVAPTRQCCDVGSPLQRAMCRGQLAMLWGNGAILYGNGAML